MSSHQQVIKLYEGAAPGSETWDYHEQSAELPLPLVYNVSEPTLTAFLPDPAIATGAAIVLCPGGGFFILEMKNTAIDVAEYLCKKGIAVFILKYRLAQSFTDKPVAELYANMAKGNIAEKTAPIIPLAISDGRKAIEYLREHAAEFGLSSSRIGIIGFSAGATVADAAAINYIADNRPDFVGSFYGYIPPEFDGPVPADAPPIFLAAASDDQFGLQHKTVELYLKWIAAKRVAELHIYEKGGHAFGMKKLSTTVDTWMDTFIYWLSMNGWLAPNDQTINRSEAIL